MAVKIRLARFGKRSSPHYRVVVIDKERPRDGKTIEILGQYDPRSKGAVIKVNRERLDWWVSKGAQCTDTIRNLLKKVKA
jgi:small subunit ribosomal protein S16